MPEAISDTGPVLHLQEIGQLTALLGIAPLVLPDLVAQELEVRGSGAVTLGQAGIEFRIAWIEASEWQEILRTVEAQIQPADAQVFALARAGSFRSLSLTDDLALRRLLEAHGVRSRARWGFSFGRTPLAGSPVTKLRTRSMPSRVTAVCT